ncbi:MAG: sugar transferase [Clostridia bacterium]|nr:sugar transferase [Clostridia bacterium]
MNKLQHAVEEFIDDRALYQNVSKSYLVSKRAFDIAASLAGILVLSPFFLIIAAIIKLDSPGPVLFSQDRVGYKGKVFAMYKFRSMVSNAEQLFSEVEKKNQVSGFMFKVKDDPRVTRFGHFIRRTSIDELPQLFNVLKGEMSLVGPRPPLIREVNKYDNWHTLRMSVIPGITGLWQIRGRNKVGFEEMVRLDLKYIRERNFFYDLKIIFKTIPVLVGDSKAF